MAIVARDPKKPRWHVILTGQKNVLEEERFAFEYVGLDLDRDANLRDNMMQVTGMGDDRKEKYLLGRQDVELLRTSVRNWKNLKDEDGKEIAYGLDKLDWIEPKVREEMIRVIKGEDPLSASRKKEYEESLK